jgi:hypothetical protein
MEGDMESSQGLLARRSARIVLALLLAAILSFFALLALEGSGPGPVRPLTNILSNSPASRSQTIQNDGATPSTTMNPPNCNDNDNQVIEGTPKDKDPNGECEISGG